jgi:hypothetical protein
LNLPDHSKMTTRELLIAHTGIMAELRHRRLSRTGNNVVADLAERVVVEGLSLLQARSSMTGYDATDVAGRRFEIKARRRTSTSRPTHLSALRGLEKRHFDELVVVIFEEDFTIWRAVRLDYETACAIARPRPHVNGHVIFLKDLWECPGAADVTALMAAALDAVTRPMIPARDGDDPAG